MPHPCTLFLKISTLILFSLLRVSFTKRLFTFQDQDFLRSYEKLHSCCMSAYPWFFNWLSNSWACKCALWTVARLFWCVRWRTEFSYAQVHVWDGSSVIVGNLWLLWQCPLELEPAAGFSHNCVRVWPWHVTLTWITRQIGYPDEEFLHISDDRARQGPTNPRHLVAC